MGLYGCSPKLRLSATTFYMPEVLGDAAIPLDPMDAAGFAMSVVRLLSDENLRRSLGVAGIQQLRKFSWNKSVRQVPEGFESRSRDNKVGATESARPEHGRMGARGIGP